MIENAGSTWAMEALDSGCWCTCLSGWQESKVKNLEVRKDMRNQEVKHKTG